MQIFTILGKSEPNKAIANEKCGKSEIFARPERVKQPKEVDGGRKEEEERGEAQVKQRERKRGGGQSNNTEREEAPSLFFFFFQYYIDKATLLEFSSFEI